MAERLDARTVPSRMGARACRIVEGKTPDEVYAFIRPAESAVLIDPDTVKAFTVPRTGPGVGEQQCFITRQPDGSDLVLMATVVAEDAPWSAETSTTVFGIPSGARYELENVDGGTRLTLRPWADVPPLEPMQRAKFQQDLEQSAERYVLRVKTLLEGPALDLLPQVDAPTH